MVDAQEVKHRGVEVVHVDAVLRDVVPELIGGAVDRIVDGAWEGIKGLFR